MNLTLHNVLIGMPYFRVLFGPAVPLNEIDPNSHPKVTKLQTQVKPVYQYDPNITHLLQFR